MFNWCFLAPLGPSALYLAPGTWKQDPLQNNNNMFAKHSCHLVEPFCLLLRKKKNAAGYRHTSTSFLPTVNLTTYFQRLKNTYSQKRAHNLSERSHKNVRSWRKSNSVGGDVGHSASSIPGNVWKLVAISGWHKPPTHLSGQQEKAWCYLK